METGLYFGSFNPIHNGHLAVARWICNNTPIDEVRLIISALNPLKSGSGLLPGETRLEMARRALRGVDENIRISAIELSLPLPSYTIDTIREIRKAEPDNRFTIIMGEDNLYSLDKWKGLEELTATCQIYAYPRSGFKKPPRSKTVESLLRHADITLLKAPLMEVSASDIRRSIAEGRDASHLLPAEVWSYIRRMNLYRGRHREDVE